MSTAGRCSSAACGPHGGVSSHSSWAGPWETGTEAAQSASGGLGRACSTMTKPAALLTSLCRGRSSSERNRTERSRPILGTSRHLAPSGEEALSLPSGEEALLFRNRCHAIMPCGNGSGSPLALIAGDDALPELITPRRMHRYIGIVDIPEGTAAALVHTAALRFRAVHANHPVRVCRAHDVAIAVGVAGVEYRELLHPHGLEPLGQILREPHSPELLEEPWPVNRAHLQPGAQYCNIIFSLENAVCKDSQTSMSGVT